MEITKRIIKKLKSYTIKDYISILPVFILTALLIFLMIFAINAEAKNKERFIELDTVSTGPLLEAKIIYDKETGVEYWMSLDTYSINVLVDKDGKPLIYGD